MNAAASFCAMNYSLSNWRYWSQHGSNFCVYLFQLQNTSHTQHFENSVPSMFSTQHSIIPKLRGIIGDIRRPPEGEVEYPVTGNMWAVASNGSCWVHTNFVINTPPESSSQHFSTTIQTAYVDVLITISPSVNGSGCLFVKNDECMTCRIVPMCSRNTEGLRGSYPEYFRPQWFSYYQKRSHFHPRAVGVSQLVHHLWLRGIFTNRGGQ